MKNRSRSFLLAGAGVGMLCLIIDSRYAAQYASDALMLCLKTVIPSLFPMFVLSGLMVAALTGSKSKALSALETLLGLPKGGGCIFLLGAVGGFPVGAQCVVQAMDSGLSKKDGERMLGYCNNCSPAFLFGILGSIFVDSAAPLLVFLIQLETAAVAAVLWRGAPSRFLELPQSDASLPKAVNRAVRSMVSVCAWVILAGVVTGFLKRWLFPFLPEPVPTVLTGLMEITGGVLDLGSVGNEKLRFVLCCVFVCFGGISVLLQIQSLVTEKGLSMSLCVRQKLFQSLLGGVLALLSVSLGPGCLLIPPIFVLLWKKAVEIPQKSVYNNLHKGGFDHAVPKKD